MSNRINFPIALIAILCSVTQLSCRDRSTSVEPISIIEEITLEEYSLMLWSAYEDSSLDQLDEFLQSWLQEIPANSLEHLSPTHLTAYKIFEIFYQPYDPYASDTVSEWATKFYEGTEYFIIPNQMLIHVVEPDDLNDPRYFAYSRPSLVIDTIFSFAPPFQSDEQNVLYYNEKFRLVLEEFIGPDSSAGPRVEFLNNRLKIYPGHDFGYHILTHPLGGIVNISRDFSRALVQSRYYSSGYNLFMSNQNNLWVRDSIIGTWVM